MLPALKNIAEKLGTAQLIAISKGRSASKIEEALNFGLRRFGENRVQEASIKFAALRNKYSDIELHLIGPLQRNKVKQALSLFDVIQTIDRPQLAEVIARHLPSCGRKLRFFVQVNIGQEAQKSGVLPQDLPGLLAHCQSLNLPICGLMCIPPEGQPATPYFQHLADLAKHRSLPELSMGMSADFEEALACGATYIRVGSALFGRRSIVLEEN